MSILEKIHGHRDLKQLDAKSRERLCEEIRDFLVSSLSKTGGHVASNLGVVELTVAIETVYDTQKDRLVFDVGHQSYIHKLLTDRQTGFASLRQYGGMAGFPKPSESDTDAFVAGHASSSVSIALGMAKARTLSGGNYDVVALMGDGAATGGLAYEGLSNAAVSKEPMVVILNDNAMSIDWNVGGMASHLRQLRTKEKYLGMKARYKRFLFKIPGGKAVYKLTSGIKGRLRRMLIPTTIFESMGFTYLGPVDGHDTEHLITLLRIARQMRRPVLLHVMTQKGKGYAPAEEHPKLFHGIGKFDSQSGALLKTSPPGFSEQFGNTMVQLAADDSRLCAITAAMPGGTGLLDFAARFPQRMFDVGIAEEHAVSMAGGLAKQGMIPVVAIYSTFLQRAYDQILQDVCMLGLHVIFAVDRAGLVGEDGETHHGIYDVGFLRQAPGLTVLAPASHSELTSMLFWAVRCQSGPVAIRYPRGGDKAYRANNWKPHTELLKQGALASHRKGDRATLITYGTLLNNVLEGAERLAEQGIETTVLQLQTLSPLPSAAIAEAMATGAPVILFEETDANCGVGAQVALELNTAAPNSRVYVRNLGDGFVPHGAVEQLYMQYGLDADGISKFVQEVLTGEN